ncbi:MAG TPA: carbamoyltransferase HypF [Pyrinomonadaceae bacterium]|nr:carbamoyltransferase HypF [Pyrinomonadaceae bacterium]
MTNGKSAFLSLPTVASITRDEEMATRSKILVRGIVQGVGFRPFVYSQANRRSLRGRVLNNTSGVLIEVEGNHDDIAEFVSEIKTNPPPLSRIESVECSHNLVPADYREFQILESTHDGAEFVPVSPDVATCADCLRELLDENDRRYLYPFINCTNCGPRFTIIEDIPYDRARTTMRDFEMCDECRSEYENPLDRRFHAEPIACRVCGPQLYLFNADGFEVGRDQDSDLDIIPHVKELLTKGRVVSIKGIGGFHLACDALNASAVETLRTRKYREDKPFAMMAESVDLIREYCLVSGREERLLQSPSRPVVLLERKENCAIPSSVAPCGNTLGFMLPYSPLHYLLLQDFGHPLVMTSGNVSDEPICYTDTEATSRLERIADYFLLHDRRIHMRSDDSVARITDGQEMMVRRSRGYAPAPLRTSMKFDKQILACGAELKNTFCLTRHHHAFVSHHIGDLENLETLCSFTEGIDHFKRLFHLQPEVVAYDLHPEYLSTKFALELDDVTTKIGIQHHHAHIASCMADNELEGEVIGVAMDGLGYGTDGRMWGGEFFVADYTDAERVAHLANVSLPGGAKAIKEPWRMAATYLQETFGADFLKLELPFVKDLDKRAWATLRSMISKGVNSPETSSMGRLFDAVSSLIGVRSHVNYEGQAAIELESIADSGCCGAYEFKIDGDFIMSGPVIREAVGDLLAGVPAPGVSARFHQGVAQLIAEIAVRTRDERGLNRVALSGGVFQNMLLLRTTKRLLHADGFQVYTHSRVPTNDGGISLGQAAVANAQIRLGRH